MPACDCSTQRIRHLEVQRRADLNARRVQRRLRSLRRGAAAGRRDVSRSSGICFERACQDEADRLFAASILIPIAVSTALAVFWWRQQAKGDEGEDVNTTEGPSLTAPEREGSRGLLFRPVSYTPWPVEGAAAGERVRVGVGPTSDLQKTTFVFERLLSKTSQIFAVSLPRPMGIVFEEEARTGRVVVADLIEGTAAYQRSRVAKLDNQRQQALEKGDVLRACTCTNFVYGSTALFGAKAPTRTIVLYGADNQRWPQVINALKRGDQADGPVTLVVERS